MAKIKMSRSPDYLINKKFYGDEPVSISSKVNLIRAFNWYNVMCDRNKARQYLKDYFTDKAMHKTIDNIPDNRIPLTSAWLCRIATNNKQELQVNDWVRVNNDIQDAIGHYIEEEKPKTVVARPSIQDRIKERLSDIIGNIETILDSGELVNIYEWLQKNEIPAAYAKKIAEYYTPLRDEYAYVLTVNDDGYQSYTKTDIKVKMGYILKLIEDCERFSGNVKKARTPRKKKEVSVDKLLKHFKYQKENKEFKLTSVNPASIIGVQELWTFNTKYNILCVLRARGPAGLSIKRTTITGFDDKLSLSKRIGRKTETVLKEVLSGGKITLRKLMDNINSSPVDTNGRTNENLIILKVVK